MLSASGANEVAEERAELRHGVFTHFLLRELEGAADENRDGVNDVDEINRFVYRRVSEATSGRQKPERRAPRLVGEVLIGRASVLPQR